MKKILLTLACVVITAGLFAQEPAAAPAKAQPAKTAAPAKTQPAGTTQTPKKPAAKGTAAKKDSTAKAPAKAKTPAKVAPKEPEGELVKIPKDAPPEYCCREKVCNFCMKQAGECPQHKKELILEGTYYCPGDDGFDVTSDKAGKCTKCGKDLVKFDKSDRKVYKTKETIVKPAPGKKPVTTAPGSTPAPEKK